MRAAVGPPFGFDARIRLAFDDVNDLVGSRAQDDVPAVNTDEIVSIPFRVDLHDM
jgi:hypothetical protein